jgi:site-specific recombinase XerD
VLSIPPKNTRRTIVTFLTDAETDALLAAPDPTTWTGRRDQAMLTLFIQTGLRVSELTALTCDDVHLGPGAHVACHGKGRKDRITPIDTDTISVLHRWLNEHTGLPTTALFPTRRGNALSRDAVEHRLTLYSRRAASNCATLASKKVTPHILRHTTAMRLLHAGVDTTVIALWLGHESITTTQIYIHADLALKQQALDRTKPTTTPTGRYQPPTDQLLTFLERL